MYVSSKYLTSYVLLSLIGMAYETSRVPLVYVILCLNKATLRSIAHIDACNAVCFNIACHYRSLARKTITVLSDLSL